MLFIKHVYFFILLCFILPQTLFSAHTCRFDSDAFNLFSYINSIRNGNNLQSLQPNTYLDKAALNHSHYQVSHGIGHYENASRHGYTGNTASERVIKAGFFAKSASENIAYAKSEKMGVENLMTAIYHRFGFLDYEIDLMGSGEAQLPRDKNSVFTYVMSNSKLEAECRHSSYHDENSYYENICRDRKQKVSSKKFQVLQKDMTRFAPKYVIYPFNGQVDVPPAFFEEIPDPLPSYSMVGNPISIEFHPRYKQQGIKLSDISLTELKSGRKLPLIPFYAKNDPHKKLKSTQFAFYPKRRLEYNEKYEVSLKYKMQNESSSERLKWQFKTKSFENFIRVSNKKRTLKLHKNTSYTLYFKPSPEAYRDRRSDKPRFGYRYFQGSDIKYKLLDSMTIQVCLHGKKGDKFKVINESASQLKTLSLIIE